MGIIEKIRRRLWDKLVTYSRNKSFYPFLYKSVWYARFADIGRGNNEQYFTSVPNPGAGIGHQMANWIAGYWFARQFGLKFAHIPFPNQEWEDFLGFGYHEILVENLVKKWQYQKVTLPLFSEDNEEELNRTLKIILAYRGQKIIFITEQDQFYRDQFGVQKSISEKFFSAPSRIHDRLIFSGHHFNIAMHVRRGDIISNDGSVHEHFNLRFQQNDYFVKVLSAVVSDLKVKKPVKIYLFSQGTKDSYDDFSKFNNMHLCLDMSALDSFLHMVNADLLITSKSSFSYKPALLSNGIKISPENFWHGYPTEDKWILADDNGNFDTRKLNIIHA